MHYQLKTALLLSICEQAQLQSGPSVPTIAIVDDDSVALSIYKKQFSKLGANVVTFSSGEEFARSVGLDSRFLSHLVVCPDISVCLDTTLFSHPFSLFFTLHVCLSLPLSSRVCVSVTRVQSASLIWW